MCKIMLSVNRDSFTSFFSNVGIFYSIFLPSGYVRMSSTMLTSNGESRHFFSAYSCLRGKAFSHSVLSMILFVGFHRCLLSG